MFFNASDITDLPEPGRPVPLAFSLKIIYFRQSSSQKITKKYLSVLLKNNYPYFKQGMQLNSIIYKLNIFKMIYFFKN